MLYLIFLVLGIAFIVIGLKSNTERDVPVSLYLISFLWLTVQVAGVIFESLKTKFNEFPSPTYDFKLFDHTTWNGIEWLYVIGLVVYFLILLFLSIRHKWPTYMLILLGIAMLEYDLLAFIVGCILPSDFFLLRLLSIVLNLVLNSYLGLMAYISIFGIFSLFMPFKDYNGAKTTAGRDLGIGGGMGTGSSRMPSSIHSSDGTTYYLRQNLGYGTEYVASDDPTDTIVITNVYSKTGSEMDTNVGHFRF